MIDNLFVFEDEKFGNFLPLTYLRPVYDLICGMSPLLAKVVRNFPEANIHLHCRDYLKNIVKQNHAGIGVNNLNTGLGCLIVNGRLLVQKDLNEVLNLDGRDRIFINTSGEVVAAYLNTNNLYIVREMLDDVISSRKFISSLRNKTEITEVKATLLEYPWELLQHNAEQITADFKAAVPAGIIKGELDPQVSILAEYKLFVGEGSRVLPGVILNAEKGPIYIGENCTIKPHTYIEGPVYIGNNTEVLSSTLLGGTSIGPKSFVEGKIENTICQGYSRIEHSNLKYCYFADGVEMDPDTINYTKPGPLENDLVVYINGEKEKPNCLVGLIAADYAKAGPKVIITAGSVCGIATQFTAGNDTMPKYIPSFIHQTSLNRFEELSLKEVLAIISQRLQAHGIELTRAEEDLIDHVYSKFSNDRKTSKIVY